MRSAANSQALKPSITVSVTERLLTILPAAGEPFNAPCYRALSVLRRPFIIVQAQRICRGYAVFLDDGLLPLIQVYLGKSLVYQIPASDIPSTHGGAFRPAIANAMFAISLAWGLGISFDVIGRALRSFVSDSLGNPGRMNFIEGLPFRLLITYADGPVAMAELARFAQREKVGGRKILMFCGSGDRTDEFLLNTGKAATTAFDYFICSDYYNLRGRPRLEAAERLREGLIAGGAIDQSIMVAPSHDEALKMAIEKASPGDLLVIESYYGLNIKQFGIAGI